jgi:hypothetical protein
MRIKKLMDLMVLLLFFLMIELDIQDSLFERNNISKKFSSNIFVKSITCY